MPNHELPINGGCLCGAIRFQSDSAPLGAGYCHCNECRKAYGNMYTALMRFDLNAFELQSGKPQSYRSSDVATRSFCGDCGSPLWFSYDGQDELFVLGGILDNPQDWPFDREGGGGHAFTDEKVSWVTIGDGLPQHGTTVGFLEKAKRDQATDGDSA